MKKAILAVFLASLVSACGAPVEAEPVAPEADVGQSQEELTATYACSPYYYEFFYYTDCTKTVQVGWESLNCQGQRWLEGTKTSYYEVMISDLCPPCDTEPYYSTCH